MNTGAVESSYPMTIYSNAGEQKKHETPVKNSLAGDQRAGDEQLSFMVKQMQEHIKQMNVSLVFSTYGNRGEKVAVVVADKETGEVIREIPPKEIQNLYARMSELAGLIFNRQV
ncbi:MAG TPA: flagellar protein FlaG [Syntrophales bacterium]|nr:flagellar protein FlaG [Syntrophales bacterium]HPC33094.1 flagellar protein FlaG [Syntrophales bacterium]HRU88360.1 flagellar protein FlaG [Syntrophales bacterium]